MHLRRLGASAVVVGLVLLAERPAKAQAACSPGVFSRFWERLDALCTQVDALRAATVGDPQKSRARDEVVAYCLGAGSTRSAPEFAATREEERVATLAWLGTIAGAPVDTTRMVGEAIVEPSTLLSDLARRLVPDHALQTGRAADPSIRAFTKVICRARGLEAYLPESCAPIAGPEPLLELRDRLVRDLVAIPRSKLDDLAARPRPREVLRATMAVIDTASEALDLYHLVRRLADETVRDVRGVRDHPCSMTETTGERWVHPGDLGNPKSRSARWVVDVESEPAAKEPASGGTAATALETPRALMPRPPAMPGDTLGVAARILEALLQDGPDTKRPPDHYARLVARALADHGLGAPEALSSLRSAATLALVAELQRLRELQGATDGGGIQPDQRREQLERMARAIGHAASIVLDQPWSLPEASFALLRVLADGNVTGIARAAARLVQEFAPEAPGSHRAMTTLACAVDFVRATNEGARSRALRACVLPWSEPILLDGSLGGRISTTSNRVTVTSRLMLGYNGEDWGVAAEGAYYAFDTGVGSRFDNGQRGRGGVEGWLTSSSRHALRVEGRLSLTGGGTQTARFVSDDIPLFAEQSYYGGSMLLVGLRYQTSHTAVGLWAGGGGLYERYKPVVTTFSSYGRLDKFIVSTTDTTQAAGKLRFRATQHIVPRTLVLRGLLDTEGYRMQYLRDVAVFDAEDQRTIQSAERAVAAYLELSARAFLDLEAARFGGFVPGVGGGIDYLEEVAPVFVFGVRREAF